MDSVLERKRSLSLSPGQPQQQQQQALRQQPGFPSSTSPTIVTSPQLQSTTAGLLVQQIPLQKVLYPISCVECRRRKIKCCRRYPCNQCVRRGMKCEYPEKFRSIEVNNLISNDEYGSNSAIASPLDTSGSNILSSTISVSIAKENEVLKRRIANLEKKLRQLENPSNDQNDFDNDTELSLEKYYGPNSSVFMIKLTQDAKNMEFNEFMKEKKNQIRKRELPNLIPLLWDSKSDKNLKMTNFSLICKLVSIFFQLRNYCNNFINEKEVFNFLHNYTDIKHWSNDDDLLLLIMILVTTMRSLQRDDPLMVDYKINYDFLNKKLMTQFQQLKNGIKNETLKSLKAYVLACEHLYYHSQAEASWNLLFHTVSNAYSLGLHVYDKEIEISLKNSKRNTLKVIQNDPRTSLWLTINFISSVLCSVVGRPNPVTFTFQPLINSQDINLNYKIALSEITKASTKVLIDSYRVSISYSEITRLDEDFEREIEVYETLFIDKDEEQRELERQELEKWRRMTKRHRVDSGATVNGKTPVKKENDFDVILNLDDDETHSVASTRSNSTDTDHISLLDTPCETLCDLILFYSNRAKFHQPFMSTYQTSTKILLNSVSKTIQHTINLVKILTTKINYPNFQSIYPFFYCFLYQSFIVFYTFLHLSFENILFFYKHEILEIHRNLQNLFKSLQGYWKKNAVRIIEQIFKLVASFKEQYEARTKTGSKNMALYPSLSNTTLSLMSDQPMMSYENLGTDFNLEIPSVPNTLSMTPTSPTRAINQNAISTTNNSYNSNNTSVNSNNNIISYNNIDHNMLQWDKNAFDNYQVDPVLGFDLNDPFFMANPEGGIPNDYFGNVGVNDNRSTSNSTSV